MDAVTSAEIPLPAGFEFTHCELCGSQDATFEVERGDMFLGGTDLYRMVRCQQCDAVYQNPRPGIEKIGAFYPESYPEFRPIKASSGKLRTFIRQFGSQKQSKVILRHKSEGSLLDAGCATGAFLVAMQRYPGWSLHGVEPAESAARYAKETLGLNVVQGDIFSAELSPNSFDVITLWDVLEHVHQPKHVLDRISNLLKPGGLLVVNHPNLDSMDRKLFGQFWLGYELPRHITLFPKTALQQAAQAVGLTPIEHRCVYGSHSATATHVRLWLKAKAPRINAQLVFRALTSPPARLLLYPLFKLVDTLGLGSNVTSVFQKAAVAIQPPKVRRT